MTDSFKLKYKINEKGFKYQYLASQLGIARTTLYNKVNNESEFFGNEILKLSELLGLSLEEREEIFFNKKVDK